MMLRQPLTGTARVQVPARLIDLSLGGAQLAIAAPLAPDKVYDFSLELDPGTLVAVQGQVCRCRPYWGAYRVGVQFVAIQPEDEQRLKDYVSRPV